MNGFTKLYTPRDIEVTSGHIFKKIVLETKKVDWENRKLNPKSQTLMRRLGAQ